MTNKYVVEIAQSRSLFDDRDICHTAVRALVKKHPNLSVWFGEVDEQGIDAIHIATYKDGELWSGDLNLWPDTTGVSKEDLKRYSASK